MVPLLEILSVLERCAVLGKAEVVILFGGVSADAALFFLFFRSFPINPFFPAFFVCIGGF